MKKVCYYCDYCEVDCCGGYHCTIWFKDIADPFNYVCENWCEVVREE